LLRGVLLQSDGGDAEWADLKPNAVREMSQLACWEKEHRVVVLLAQRGIFKSTVRKRLSFIPTKDLRWVLE